MKLRLDRAATSIVALLCSMIASASPEEHFCSELSTYLVGKHNPKLADPSRMPTEAEQHLIDDSKVELLEWTDYGSGVLIVDADNDGKEDVLAWNIQGSARDVVAALFDFHAPRADSQEKLVSKGRFWPGTLQEPYFVTFNGINYVVATETGDDEGISVSQISKKANGLHELHTLCRTRIMLSPETQCRHPACKKLKNLIGNIQINRPFVTVEWPHKYLPPAGLEVYFSELWSKADFDNTRRATTIWRIGRREHLNEQMYWKLLGQGTTMPQFDPRLWPQRVDDSSNDHRFVLPGFEHDRLRRAIARQSEILGRQLHRPIDLVTEAEFFLFTDDTNRTYWAWDFGTPPLGAEIHISYATSKRSNYIGAVRTRRSRVLVPCISDCIRPFDL